MVMKELKDNTCEVDKRLLQQDGLLKKTEMYK